MKAKPAPDIFGTSDDWTDDALLAALRAALRDDALALYYQPQVAARDGRVTGFEALLRWVDARHGPVPPGRFIPVAEAGGLIDAIGEWVLRRACVDLHGLRHAYGETVRMAVNVSPLQLQRGDLVDVVGAALSDARLAPDALELELTESAPLSPRGEVRARLDVLRAMGVTLALDDFGIGHANLAYLMDLDVDTLKIDGRFVQADDSDGRAAAVLSALISLAADLELTLIAECVETEAQFARLLACERTVATRRNAAQQAGCGIQGFYFSRPLDSDTLSRNATTLQATCCERALRVVA